MIEIAELLEPTPRPQWALLRQVGISRVVSLLADGEQKRRWLRPGRSLGSQCLKKRWGNGYFRGSSNGVRMIPERS
jgi:hypothetical protein